MSDFLQATGLLLVLLNPFLVILYLIDALEKLGKQSFARVVIRAGLISMAVLCAFALLGDAFFDRVVHAEFASFQLFGGVVFLLIGLQFVFRGPTAIEMLRGESKNLAGSLAMPILIGPGTISAAVITGERTAPWLACVGVAAAVGICVVVMVLLKSLHDWVRPKNEEIIERYIGVAGRIMALFIGTVAIEMIMRGIRDWIALF
jgi:small neutral amino acid transporter SnatA (MarC family)